MHAPWQSPGQRTGDDPRIAHLDGLSREVRRRRWLTRLVVPPEPRRHPSLRVTNPLWPRLSESVCCERGPSGTWWLYWSFAAPIAPAGDSLAAAVEVSLLLAGPRLRAGRGPKAPLVGAGCSLGRAAGYSAQAKILDRTGNGTAHCRASGMRTR